MGSGIITAMGGRNATVVIVHRQSSCSIHNARVIWLRLRIIVAPARLQCRRVATTLEMNDYFGGLLRVEKVWKKKGIIY